MTTKLSLQSVIIRLLSQRNIDKRLGRGQFCFPEAVERQFTQENKPTNDQITQTLWALLGKGIIYIDISQPAPENWEWCLTNAGEKSASDEQFNPDDPERYLERLKNNVPELSSLVYQYTNEAVNCYYNESYLASAVMLGAASEAVFLELAEASIPWLEGSGDGLQVILENPRQPYVNKFREFRKRLESRKMHLPTEIADKLSITFDSLLDQYRLVRNEIGHPSGKTITREDQYISLQMFGRYLQTVYKMKSFFLGNGLTMEEIAVVEGNTK